MRKHQWQLILEMIRTIEQAQSKLQYADCQEGAQAIGNFIESIQGTDTQTVALLREYCELLFKASKGEIKEKQLRKHLIKIENSAMSELRPDKIEILFLIFKASMSDSLESVYLAAKADPACDAFWMPIPYFAVNADGTLGTMYYEGAEHYSSNITCTNWQTYDIEARRPDIVFIHYAYDNNTSNASIHPAFYSKRLREHCGLLIYIPYFVTTDEIVEDYCAYLPGVLQANCVIVESESVRQSYIKHYKAFDEANSCRGRFGKAEKKYIALGSPKFDKGVNISSENHELPADWSRLIYNPDGSKKKIIFYNTHMFAWITLGGGYFEKLRSVLDFFRNRGDVVLWWRPHPNTELNFELKRPDWIDAYREIIEGYKSGAWGIYDDTPDVHRAIAWCDAYLGDRSSLIPIFSVTGKPVMHQNLEAADNAKKNILLFESCYDDGEYIWFAACWFNGLFKCSKETWAAEYIGHFPGEKRDGQRLFASVARCGDKLYFAPLAADQVAVYDLVSGEFERIELRNVGAKNHDKYTEFYKFVYAVPVGDHVYLFPSTYPAIVKINTKTCEIEYIDDWVPKVDHLRKDTTLLFGTPTTSEREIIAPFLFTDAVLSLDCDMSKTQVIPLQTGDMAYYSICFDGVDFWLSRLCKEGTGLGIVKWNRETGTTENIDLSEFGSLIFSDAGLANGFFNLFFKNGKVYALPQHCDTAFCIDVDTKSVAVMAPFINDFYDKELAGGIFSAIPCYWMREDTVYGVGMTSGSVYSCDIAENFRDNEYKMTTTMDSREMRRGIITKEAAQCSELSDCIYYDSEFHGIDDFIDMLVHESRTDELCEKQVEIAEKAYTPNGNEAGKRIYEYCKALALK